MTVNFVHIQSPAPPLEKSNVLVFFFGFFCITTYTRTKILLRQIISSNKSILSEGREGINIISNCKHADARFGSAARMHEKTNCVTPQCRTFAAARVGVRAKLPQ